MWGNLAQQVQAAWRNSEVVKVKCHGPLAINMKVRPSVWGLCPCTTPDVRKSRRHGQGDQFCPVVLR
jgi:CRS1 / YhbY (CRM) domain